MNTSLIDYSALKVFPVIFYVLIFFRRAGMIVTRVIIAAIVGLVIGYLVMIFIALSVASRSGQPTTEP